MTRRIQLILLFIVLIQNTVERKIVRRPHFLTKLQYCINDKCKTTFDSCSQDKECIKSSSMCTEAYQDNKQDKQELKLSKLNSCFIENQFASDNWNCIRTNCHEDLNEKDLKFVFKKQVKHDDRQKYINCIKSHCNSELKTCVEDRQCIPTIKECDEDDANKTQSKFQECLTKNQNSFQLAECSHKSCLNYLQGLTELSSLDQILTNFK